MQVPGRFVPWIFLLLAAPVALWALAVAGPTACGEMKGAFREGVTTESSTTLELLADHCTITRNRRSAGRFPGNGACSGCQRPARRG